MDPRLMDPPLDGVAYSFTEKRVRQLLLEAWREETAGHPANAQVIRDHANDLEAQEGVSA